ncbi:TRAP dicarboxylate transporter subunit DctM [Kiloniella spongiae]|uniref:TRAP transporter large permease protein n=1 Tax=Kiloniella spongiae TaxID=1489064 RepID=A0A0H2MUF2_9PROT|nr:TRAP transporter large permease subunit [Kiloniella spongiae]KLN60345.1 TRAP dicarboxylate transporter subunit DctM [Kiloniella spongiae]
MIDMDPLLVTAIMFGSMLFLMIIGTPLAWALLIVGTGSAINLWGWDSLDMVVISTFGVMNTFILVALPMFIFMGLVLQRSGITDDLFGMVYKVMGGVKGGLGAGTILICAVIAAMAGVTAAATVSLGLIALPAMLKRGYDKRLVTGAIMAGGALGFLIPPSITMILYAFLTRESIGKLFAAGVMPGLMLAAIYIIYILVVCRVKPSLGPAIAEEERVDWRGKIASLRSLILPGIIITTVLVFTMKGVTSPTEASVIGAVGAVLSAAVNRTLSLQVLRGALQETARIMGMLMWIMIGAVIFSKIYIGLGAGQIIAESIIDGDLSPNLVLLMIILTYFLLGMFLDDSAILFITVPLFVPIINELGYDPVWFGIVFILAMQTAYLTPPFGYNLFYMRSVAPPEIRTVDIYHSVTPFILLQMVGLALVVFFPQIALWLPQVLFN